MDKLLERVPDERGIDGAIAAFVATKICGGSSEDAERGAKAILELFGFDPARTIQGSSTDAK